MNATRLFRRATGCLWQQRSILLAVALIFGGSNCVVADEPEVVTAKLPGGEIIRYEGARASKHANGMLKSCLLAEDQAVGGIRFTNSGKIPVEGKHGPPRYTRRGVEFYPSGQVKSGYLAQDTKIDGVVYRGGVHKSGNSYFQEEARIDFFPNGKVMNGFLAKSREIDGLPLRGMGGSDMKRRVGSHDVLLVFYENGRLKRGCLSRAVDRHGIKFKAGPVQVHDNGVMSGGHLAGTQEVEGRRLPSALKVLLTREGKLQAEAIAKTLAVGGSNLPGATLVFRDREGILYAAVLGADAVIAGHALPGGTFVSFEGGEQPHRVHLFAPTVVQTAPFPAGSDVYLGQDGKVSYAYLGAEQEVQGMLLATGDDMELYPSGRLKEGKLAADQTISWQTFKKGSAIQLYRNGEPVEPRLEAPRTVGKAKLEAGDRILNYFETGELESVELGSPRDIGGTPCGTGRPVLYHVNGRLKECYLEREAEVEGVIMARYSMIEYFDDGNLRRHTPVESLTLGEVTYRPGEELVFYASGIVAQGTLSGDHTIGGITYQSSGTIFLDKSGKVINYEPVPPKYD